MYLSRHSTVLVLARYYQVKFYQNHTSNFQVTRDFRIKKIQQCSFGQNSVTFCNN